MPLTSRCVAWFLTDQGWVPVLGLGFGDPCSNPCFPLSRADLKVWSRILWRSMILTGSLHQSSYYRKPSWYQRQISMILVTLNFGAPHLHECIPNSGREPSNLFTCSYFFVQFTRVRYIHCKWSRRWSLSTLIVSLKFFL